VIGDVVEEQSDVPAAQCQHLRQSLPQLVEVRLAAVPQVESGTECVDELDAVSGAGVNQFRERFRFGGRVGLAPQGPSDSAEAGVRDCQNLNP
jgi:hypothetical protein